jgi:uncharacterized protein (TIGR02266 family)
LVDPNTRQGKRTPVTLKIKFKSETLEQFIERYAIDVSQGGIFIRTKEPLAVGTQMKFEFQLRDASPLIAGEGTVVWTRENDPSRPAIAPGMGVRFDRLADGSQGILERILAEKAKQAPQRPAADTTKPPMFSDTPTRVAPAPMQEALLGKDNGQRSRRGDEPGHNDSHTPLPRPMPFHSDADEFPDEAFEEATKVRALDELIAQTAEGGADSARRANGRTDMMSDSISDRAETQPADLAATAANVHDLPTPPDLARPVPRLLDTSPSPRFEASQPAQQPMKTQLGVEPARARISTPPPLGAPGTGAPMEAPPLPSGMRAVAAEHTEPARMPPLRTRSSAPMVILILAIVAAGAAAVWFLVLRPQQIAETEASRPVQPGSGETPGSAAIATPGSAATPTSGSADSAAPAGSATPPVVETADTIIDASVDHATIEVAGTPQAGPAPFTAKLEKGKPYKVRVSAPTFAAVEIEIKGGDDGQMVKLSPKPRVIAIESDPKSAGIYVDGANSGKVTPTDLELTAAQAAKKSVRIQLRKAGYRSLERTVDLAKLTEEGPRMLGKLSDLKMQVLPPITQTSTPPVRPSNPDGGDAGSGSAADGTTPPGPGSASAPPTPPASGSGSAAEPEPAFNKQP